MSSSLLDQASGADWLVGGGEMGKLIRSMDWSKSPLGPLETWPQSLRTTVSLCLASNFPISLAWGPHHIQIYNDGYWPICGAKHPRSMGQDFKECWEAPWPAIGGLFTRALEGETGFLENQRMFLDRNGYLEETFFTFSFSPVRDETGGIGGLFHPVTETTSKMLSERRTRTLRDLAARTGKAKTTEEALLLAVPTLVASDLDLPFVLLYSLEATNAEARLVGSSGLTPGMTACPETLYVGGAGELWPLAEVLQAGSPVEIDNLEQRFSGLTCGPYPESLKTAIALPISPPGAERPIGVIIAGVSSRLPLNEVYRGFFDQLSAVITAAVANARAYEEERKRAEMLAELDRAKTAFFSNVSHEFRTPLTLMLGPLEELLAQPDLAPAEQHRIQIAHRNSLRLLKLVNTLLEFSRIEAGRVDSTFEPLDLAAYTIDLVSMFRAAVEKAGLELIVDCAALPEAVYVDRDMWEKIVLNLVSNAFKFTEKGRIHVRQHLAGDHVELQVSDTGTGIPAEKLDAVFKRFHRIENSRSRTHEGTGIGLALVEELARAHGGTVRVESTLGSGSAFTVSIPLGKRHLPPDRLIMGRQLTPTRSGANAFVEEALRWIPDADRDLALMGETEAVESAGAGPRPRVLVADDNADMREYVSRILASRYEVVAVADGKLAMEAVVRERPELVLSDVMMPGMDGFSLLRELRGRAETKALPIILLSARAGEESRVEGLEAGADDYLVKPFSAKELLARVRSNLELARTRREIAQREQESAHAATVLEGERTARREAERVGRMKDEFLATLSHELRTPLNAILGWSHIVRQAKTSEDLNDGLDIIERNARAQAQIIEDLLDMSRIISGKVRLDVQRLDLAAIVRGAVETTRPTADAKGVRLQAVIDPLSGLVVMGDANRLQQVMWNLLSNAIKFTPKGGRVQVLLERVNSHLEISVVDSGEGIPPAFLPFVFDRFRQADASTSRRHGGLGLGLAIVKQLVELHGGTVRVTSAGVGCGATFAVMLPLMTLQVDSTGESERRHPGVAPVPTSMPDACVSIHGVRVLIVDDEPDARALVKRLLEDCHALVETAGSAAEALQRMEFGRFDVLISDVGMPGEDGYALIKRVRLLGRSGGGDIPAVALTAYARAEDRVKAISAGFQMHLTKPVEPVELVTIVASAAGRIGR